MAIQESGEMYLETIYLLSKQSKDVHSVDVGEYMGYSKPSVSRAIGLLKKGGYVEMEKDGALTQFLIQLGVDPEIAAEDACKIEHDISDISLAAIKKSLK